MARVEVGIDTKLSPEQVIGALTDFSDRRPDIWPGLARSKYKVYSVGEKSADVQEGNEKPNIWARELYDWSVPGVVKWTVKESNFCTAGSRIISTISAGEKVGSHIHIDWERYPTTFGARLMMMMIVLTRGAPIKVSIRKALTKMEQSQESY
jgi:hypothetical protein